VLSAALGLVVGADAARASGAPWRLPPGGYWWSLGGGLALALIIAVAATLPLLGRLTSPQNARFE
jgi:hypothetical protein